MPANVGRSFGAELEGQALDTARTQVAWQHELKYGITISLLTSSAAAAGARKAVLRDAQARRARRCRPLGQRCRSACARRRHAGLHPAQSAKASGARLGLYKSLLSR